MNGCRVRKGGGGEGGEEETEVAGADAEVCVTGGAQDICVVERALLLHPRHLSTSASPPRHAHAAPYQG